VTFESPEAADLALLDEVDHRRHRLLDRRLVAAVVEVVEVDHVHLQAAQARLTGLLDVRRVGADAPVAALSPHQTELAGEDDLVATARDGPPDQGLVPVRVRRVQHRHPDVQRTVDHRDRVPVRVPQMLVAQTHGAEPLLGKVLGAQQHVFHLRMTMLGP